MCKVNESQSVPSKGFKKLVWGEGWEGRHWSEINNIGDRFNSRDRLECSRTRNLRDDFLDINP